LIQSLPCPWQVFDHYQKKGLSLSKILIVDDDTEYRENLKEILDNAGYSNDMAGSAREALELLEDQHFVRSHL
jgi:DNA-binding NtrC family response regulator